MRVPGEVAGGIADPGPSEWVISGRRCHRGVTLWRAAAQIWMLDAMPVNGMNRVRVFRPFRPFRPVGVRGRSGRIVLYF